jgi:FlaA1/EpsC-like NDP-sugar epimerase
MNSKHYVLRLAGTLTVIAVVSTGAYVAAFLLRFAGDLPHSATAVLSQTIVFAVAIKVAAAYWFRVHRGWNRYVTFHDVVTLAKSAACASVGITLVDAMALTAVTIPRSVVLLDGGATLLLLAVVRALPRAIRDIRWRIAPSSADVRVLIVGANDAGETLLRAIRSNPTLNYLPIGFIDAGARRVGDQIGGAPVLGKLADFAALARRHRIAEVLITAGELPGKSVRELMQQASEAKCRVKVLPSYEQLLGDNIEIQPRPVAIADLLRRPSVELNIEQTRQWLNDRVVMVTGSAGSIGSEICRQLLRHSHAKIVLVDRSETGQFFLERKLRDMAPGAKLEVVMADITDESRMRVVFEEHRPAVIFHAAAYKHVPLMEAHPGEAVKNILLATRSLCDLADEFGAQSFVMISTDKAVNPTSVMGSCKRLAEQYVQAKSAASACRFVTVRFGNVLDSAGSVVPIFREQIARGGPVTVTHPEMARYFMMIPEAAQLVIQAGGLGRGGEIFVLDMGEPVRIMDLARDMIRLSGLREGDDIEIRITGLRPGEKLFEELYADEENHAPTAHPKILASTVAPRQLLQVIYDLGRLTPHVNGDRDTVRAILQAIVPRYEAGGVGTLRAA